MIPLTAFRDRSVLVVGLGKTGQSAVAALCAGGANVSVWDDNADKRSDAAAEGLAVIDANSVDVAAFDDIVWSPGVPHTYPHPHVLAEKAKAAGKPLRCDVDLLAAACPDATYIGITGTNGKSTTTALTGHVFKTAGKTAAVGGNLGVPVLELEPLNENGVYILELSSYQTELTPSLSCATAVLLNIAPDHLDRHGGMTGYIAAKTELFSHQRPGATAVVGVDDDHSRAVFDHLTADGGRSVIGVSANNASDARIVVNNGVLTDRSGSSGSSLIDLRGLPTLPGQHNWQNAAAAYAVARIHDIDSDDIATAFRTFPGLPHRQEVVGRSGGVTFVNDSKATNANASEKALSCYDAIYWIAGGRAKEDGIGALRALFGRIRHACLIGEAASDFERDLRDAGVSTSRHESLDDAVTHAGALALRDNTGNATVLLSPACASFDMFDNFEQRGDAFRSAVHVGWPETQPADQGVRL